MDNIYDFSWLINDIDESMIFMLRDGNGLLGSYQVREIVTSMIDPVNVKFANINDLTNFINYATVRFTDSTNNDNFVDIPLRKLKKLYDSANDLTEGVSSSVSLQDLDAFAVHSDRVIREGYAIIPYLINIDNLKDDKEFAEILKITNNFMELSMNDKIEALEELNLINYTKSKASNNLKK